MIREQKYVWGPAKDKLYINDVIIGIFTVRRLKEPKIAIPKIMGAPRRYITTEYSISDMLVYRNRLMSSPHAAICWHTAYYTHIVTESGKLTNWRGISTLNNIENNIYDDIVISQLHLARSLYIEVRRSEYIARLWAIKWVLLCGDVPIDVVLVAGRIIVELYLG